MSLYSLHFLKFKTDDLSETDIDLYLSDLYQYLAIFDYKIRRISSLPLHSASVHMLQKCKDEIVSKINKLKALRRTDTMIKDVIPPSHLYREANKQIHEYMSSIKCE